MKKIFVIISLFLLTACSSSKDIDVEKTCKNIIEKLNNKYLVEVDDYLFTSYYFLEEANIDESILYVSNGTTADQVCVLEVENKVGVLDKIKESLNVYKASFKNYFPDEVEKIENAYIYENENYFIIIISDNEDIKTIVDNAIVFD